MARLQMPLGIRFEQTAGRIDGDVLANAGHYVLQRPAFGHVIKHIVHRNERDQRAFGDCRESGQPAIVVAAIQHAGGEPDRLPRGRALQACERRIKLPGVEPPGWQHDEIEVGDVLEQVREKQDAFAFFAATFPDGEQLGQPSP
jgi:hypothetical protein